MRLLILFFLRPFKPQFQFWISQLSILYFPDRAILLSSQCWLFAETRNASPSIRISRPRFINSVSCSTRRTNLVAAKSWEGARCRCATWVLLFLSECAAPNRSLIVHIKTFAECANSSVLVLCHKNQIQMAISRKWKEIRCWRPS